MVSDIVIPGTKIEMIRLKNALGEDAEEKEFNSKVIDFLDDETIKISMPIESGILIPLEVGEKYQFVFYSVRGLYHCKGEITERFKEGLLSILLVHLSSDLEKLQRRQYYRLEYIMDIRYHIISREEKFCLKKLEERLYSSEEEKEKLKILLQQLRAQWNLATVIDISGGGCRFNSMLEHKLGEEMVIQITYQLEGEKKECSFHAKIIYLTALEMRKGYFEYRVEFNDIDVEDRENLIKFIFEEERRIRRRERGLNR